MQIIISPAKKMIVDNDDLTQMTTPVFLDDTQVLLDRLRQMSKQQLQKLWQCNDDITELNHHRLHAMDLQRGLTAAVLAYEGIQYRYMAPRVFESKHWEYIEKHLNILSGFYGILRAADGVVPYRLEMQAKLQMEGAKNLYDFWGDKLYRELKGKGKAVLNLASKEYSKSIEKYLEPEINFFSCVFGVLEDGYVKVKATEAKMARGAMVRWCAENAVCQAADIKYFDQLNYEFNAERSSDKEFVFIKKGKPEQIQQEF